MVDIGLLKGDLEHGGRKYGLVLDIGGYYKNVITLAPSLTISYEEIDLAIALLDQLFTRVDEGIRMRLRVLDLDGALLKSAHSCGAD